MAHEEKHYGSNSHTVANGIPVSLLTGIIKNNANESNYLVHGIDQKKNPFYENTHFNVQLRVMSPKLWLIVDVNVKTSF